MLSRSSEVLISVIFFSLVAAQARVEHPTVRGRGTSFPCGGYAGSWTKIIYWDRRRLIELGARTHAD